MRKKERVGLLVGCGEEEMPITVWNNWSTRFEESWWVTGMVNLETPNPRMGRRLGERYCHVNRKNSLLPVLPCVDINKHKLGNGCNDRAGHLPRECSPKCGPKNGLKTSFS